MKKKICIITWHQYHNYGSQLQAFALVNFLRELKCNAHILNYTKKKNTILNNRLFVKLKCLLGFFVEKTNIGFLQKYRYQWLRFQEKYLYLTRPLSEDELEKETSKYKVIVCGSDQIWAPNVFNPIYMADFISRKKVHKISYAASVGLRQIPDELCPLYKKLLGDFTAVSVREEYGATLLKQKTGIEAHVVLDPTLLINKDKYAKLEVKPIKAPVKFGFCYFLSRNNWYKDLVTNYAHSQGIKLLGLSACDDDSTWIEQIEYSGPREFLWYIHHADIVFTDSYHGTIFSLIYHTDFYTFQRFAENDPINQNSRIEQLNTFFSIDNKICKSDTRVLNEEKYDFANFDKNLALLQIQSIEYINEALEKCSV